MPVILPPIKRARKKPLCEDIGHAWESTTALNVRQCRRASCRLVQHKHKGVWVNAIVKARAQTVEQSQANLWE